MTEITTAIRGMSDILPEDIHLWQKTEEILRTILHGFGYAEIRFPVVEKTLLFEKTIGEVTDIVEKEMYTFTDRNGDSLSLRPEGTAGCVRAGIENGLFYNQTQRLYYLGQFFRHERPQKGRYRQFHQFGVEAFGMPGPDIDAEIISIVENILNALGLKDHVKLQLNTLGTKECRDNYRTVCVEYFSDHYDELDEDSKKRLKTNPFRILDSKNPEMAKFIEKAPKLLDYLDQTSEQHFAKLCDYLTELKINYEINPYLVRGLDYYSHAVFEYVTTELGAQGTICAGGRYDKLVETLGGKPCPALGFAIGMERLLLLLKAVDPDFAQALQPDIYIISDDAARLYALKIAAELRQELLQLRPQLRLIMHCGSGSFKNQFKKADKTGAEIAIILGDAELGDNTVSLKHLRDESKQQITIARATLAQYLKQSLNLT